MKPAIRVENLAKQYRIGTRSADSYRTLRESLVGVATAPFRRRNPPEHSPTQDSFWALKEVCFEVAPGEVVGIIGRNGAGKSTLLKILSRIAEPTEGRAVVRGRMASLLEVGTGFHPELTGRENIYLNGSILGMSRKEINRQLDDIVAFSEIEQFLDTPVKRYSSGMYVRLAFAVAAHLSLEILIVDEVLAVGDAQFQKKCLGKMGDVAHSGRTVLFVSHNMAVVSQLCQRCILLKAGRVERDGPAGAVADYYQRAAINSAPTGHSDLTKASRSAGDGKVRFDRVTLFNSAGEVTSRFGFGEPIRVRVRMASDIEYAYGEIGCTVRTLSEVPLFTSSSTDQRRPYQIRPGWFEAEMRLDPNHLRPGVYHVQLGTTCGVVRDLVPEAIQFTIDDSRHYSANFLHRLPGHLYFPYSWSDLQFPEPVVTTAKLPQADAR
jgi:lipopolysaccharide transport system ATP-binding protein